MTTDELYQKISAELPAVLYVSGKTSTGKSSFARRLQKELGYQRVTFEDILTDQISQNGWDEQNTFAKVFRQAQSSPEKDVFISAVSAAIDEGLQEYHKVVIEGAIANSHTLQYVLRQTSCLVFVYLHPADIGAYVRNITSRFSESNKTSLAGLPKTFWDLIDPQTFEVFCQTRQLTDELAQAIEAFAVQSQHDSLKRLAEYHKLFGNIVVVEIC